MLDRQFFTAHFPSINEDKKLWLLAFLFIVPLVAARAFADSARETSVQTVSSIQDAGITQEVSGQKTATPTEEISSESTKAFTVPVTAAVPSLSPEKWVCKPTVTVGGGGFFLHRKNFRLIQPQNESESTGPKPLATLLSMV